MRSRWWWLAVAVAALAASLWWLGVRAVDDRPLPQVQPTLDVQRPTQPTREMAATATP